jgi:hypothetical protein
MTATARVLEKVGFRVKRVRQRRSILETYV